MPSSSSGKEQNVGNEHNIQPGNPDFYFTEPKLCCVPTLSAVLNDRGVLSAIRVQQFKAI